MSLSFTQEQRFNHPVDRVQWLATQYDWDFNRHADDEIMISVEGQSQDFKISINWISEIEALHIGCSFHMECPENRHIEAQSLIAIINEQLWIGHFDFWSKDKIVMFRHSLLLNGGIAPSNEQLEALIKAARTACERYLLAFHYVVQSEKTAEDALACALFETKGNA